ncbi:hypothetical protein HN587_02705 [Candidatus Woesearchaeota archaeon]|jgi:hypothetical protein|nr:hypothetical protein [Candidatus Woesearchaeota archaeon]
MTSRIIIPRLAEILFYMYDALQGALEHEDLEEIDGLLQRLTGLEKQFGKTIFQQTKSRELQQDFDDLVTSAQDYESTLVSIDYPISAFSELMNQKVMQQMTKYVELKERLLQETGFNVDKDFGNGPIDPAIKPLVVALKLVGFKTSNSCQGHSENRSTPRVYVAGNSNIPILERVVEEYNWGNPVGLWWKLNESKIIPSIYLDKKSKKPFLQDEIEGIKHTIISSTCTALKLYIESTPNWISIWPKDYHPGGFQGWNKITGQYRKEVVQLMHQLATQITKIMPGCEVIDRTHPEGTYILTAKGFGLERKQADILPLSAYLYNRNLRFCRTD